MKKAFLLLACLPIFILTMFGCQRSPVETNGNTIDIEKVQNTTQIVIGYGSNNYAALITDQEEIKQLEDIFNEAELAKSDTSIQQPYLSIAFYGKKSTTSFNIDDKDVIQLRDGSYIKSEQIKFNELYSIFNKYLSQNK